MRRALAAAAGLALAAGVAFVFPSDGDQRYRHYATVSEAAAAGDPDLELPTWLPASAADLHVQGGRSSDGWWIRASLPASGVESLRRLVVAVDVDSVRVRKPHGRPAWWMESLIAQYPANDNGLHADLFRGTGDPIPRTTVLAFDRASDAVFIWTDGIR